jgi:S1-C subfamily serine protease
MLKRIALVSLLVVASQAAASSAAPTTTIDRGIVDIDTNLGYESAAAAGTGMVLTSTGEILTNNHVIRGATTVRVIVPSTGHSYSATVVGYSVANDVAVLQMKDASDLQTVTLGDSSKVRAGQAVTAVGNAQGVGGTPSEATGKVIHLDRSITANDDNGSSEKLTGLIETNAALQPGDSGGPLLNAADEVVGMDTAASGSYSFQTAASTAYTIPIDHALSLAKQIVAGNSSTAVHIGATPFLGVDVEQPRFSNGGSSSGLVVDQVVPSSPASRAGIYANETLTTLNGRTINTPAALTSLLLRNTVGTKVTLGLLDTSGSHTTATVTLGSGPPQ